MDTKRRKSQRQPRILRLGAASIIWLMFAAFFVTGPVMGAQTYTILHKFHGAGDGANPAGTVAMTGTSVVGTTVNDGTSGYGLVFKFVPHGSGWTEDVLRSFPGGSEGANPIAGVTFASDGTIYGTTPAGAGGSCAVGGACGIVYHLTPPPTIPPTPNGPWNEAVVYTFNCASCSNNGSDGVDPYGEVIFDQSGNLYGTTRYGGRYGQCGPGGCSLCGTPGQSEDPGCYCGNSGCGAVYMLTNQGSNYPWPETRLWDFGNNSDGREPYSAVTFDSGESDLYGTTVLGGTLSCLQAGGPPGFLDTWGCGISYELTKSGSNWTENFTYPFADDQNGGYPFGTPLFSSSLFYGVTGDMGASYGGTVFKIMSGTLTTLQSLTGNEEQVSGPHARLVMDSQGNLYGTTVSGGTYNAGTIFEVPYSNGSYGTPTVLHTFTGGSDGAYPIGGLAIDSSGNLYGTTYSGVTDGSGCTTQQLSSQYPLGCGLVFEIAP